MPSENNNSCTRCAVITDQGLTQKRARCYQYIYRRWKPCIFWAYKRSPFHHVQLKCPSFQLMKSCANETRLHPLMSVMSVVRWVCVCVRAHACVRMRMFACVRVRVCLCVRREGGRRTTLQYFRAPGTGKLLTYGLHYAIFEPTSPR